MMLQVSNASNASGAASAPRSLHPGPKPPASPRGWGVSQPTSSTPVAAAAPSKKSISGSVDESGDKTFVVDKPLDEGPKRFVDGWFFNGIILLGIVINALQMGFELQFTGGYWEIAWEALEQFFTGFFLIEFLIKMVLMRPKEYFSTRANWLDCLVVIVAVLDNWFFKWVIPQEGSEFGFISILRLVRLGRILKLLRAKKELMMLIEGILSSLRSMVWLALLLGILIYTTAILFVQFVGKSDAYEGSDADFDPNYYFGDMLKASISCLNLALMKEWQDIFRPVLKKQPLFGLFVIMYVGVSSFGIMNAIIGVIVASTGRAARAADEESEKTYKDRQMSFVELIQTSVYSMDEDDDGTISPEEINKMVDIPEVVQALASVEFPIGFTMNELHCMLDKDGDGELTKHEFGQGMRRMIFSNEFQRQSLVLLAVSQQKRKLFEMRYAIEDELEEIKNMVCDLPKKFQTMLDEHVPKNASAFNADKNIPDAHSDFEKQKEASTRQAGKDAGMKIKMNSAVWADGYDDENRDRSLILQGNPASNVAQGNANWSSSPDAQAARIQALAEVSQALVVAAQSWGEEGAAGIGMGMPGVPYEPDSLRQTGYAQITDKAPLHPGIVNQHVSDEIACAPQLPRIRVPSPPLAGTTGINSAVPNAPGNAPPSLSAHMQDGNNANQRNQGRRPFSSPGGRRGPDTVKVSVV